MRTTAPYPGLASWKIQYHRQRRTPRESRSASRAGEIHLPSSSTSSTTVPFSSLKFTQTFVACAWRATLVKLS